MNLLWQDLRYGARMLLKHPGITLVTVLTLALGIGLNTAVFSVADAVLFRPLPFAQPERLVEIQQLEAGSQFTHPGLLWETFEQWRAQSVVFAGVEAYAHRNFTLTGAKEPESVGAPAVSPGLFALLGVAPQLGRLFQAEEALPGAGRVVLIGAEFWRLHFGRSPAALGKTVTLNGQPYTIVGVMPPRFKFPYGKFQLWVPLLAGPKDELGQPQRFNTVARLRGDVGLAAAQGVLDGLSARLNKEQPVRGGWQTRLTGLGVQRVNPGPRRALLVLLGAVGFVLLLACANAANLLLSRATARQGEFAIRLALGAGRGRLVRQLLTESVLIALLGGGAGVLLAWWGVDLLNQFVPQELTFLSVNEITLDRRVLLFTLGMSALTGLLCGLLPAWRASGVDWQLALKGSGGTATAERAQNRWRHALVVAEVALSLVLLVGAGLMMRAFWRLSSVPPGFEPRNLVAATLTLTESRYQTLAQQDDFYAQVKTRLAALPGVEAVTIAAGVPPQGGGISLRPEIEVEGRPPAASDPTLVLPFNWVEPDFFQTMRIPLLQGRTFGPEDTPNAPPAIIVNSEMARRYWPGESPVGKRLRFSPTGKWRTVVGVVGDVKIGRPGDQFSKMEYYSAWSQQTRSAGHRTVLVRTAADAAQLLPALKAGLWSLDREQPIYRIDTVENLLSGALDEPRFYLLLLGVFAGVTLLLVTLGIYGVMSYQVGRRHHEIGIRLALGAQPGAIVRLVLGRGLWLTVTGLALGVAASLALTRWIKSLLYEHSATDPLTFALMALLLAAVALLACWVPARRAAKVDPLSALRCE